MPINVEDSKFFVKKYVTQLLLVKFCLHHQIKSYFSHLVNTLN